MSESPRPRPADRRDPGLSRRQRLELRPLDPPRRRPRKPRGVPDQHPARVHRRAAPAAARPAGALVLPRPTWRLRRAAQRGHLARARHRARRPRAPADRRPRHPARQDPPGQGRARSLQHHLRVRRRTGRPGGQQAGRPSGERPGPARPRLRLRAGAGVVHPARGAHRVRPVDAGDHRRGGVARHPVDPAQPVLPRAARPGRPREADPGHHDLRDQRDRGRRSQRQGPHHPPPGRRRAAGPEAGVDPHR